MRCKGRYALIFIHLKPTNALPPSIKNSSKGLTLCPELLKECRSPLWLAAVILTNCIYVVLWQWVGALQE